LEKLNSIVASLAAWLEELYYFLNVNYVVAAGALIVLVAMALATKRVLAFVGVLLLSTVALLCLIGIPDFAPLSMIASYIGALAIVLVSIQSRRKSEAIQADLTALRTDVNQLLQAETRRFLADLKSSEANSINNKSKAP
jgi:uncharacterized membrane protein YccC